MRKFTLTIAIAVLVAVPAAAQFPIAQSFMTNTAPGWVFGAYAGSNFTPCLTSGNTACSPAPNADPSGSGWLRLTDSTGQTNGEAGYAYYDTAFPSNQGFAVDFEYVSWGGTGADGIGVILFDGSVTQGTFRIGAPGGSFGYAGDTAGPVYGLHLGYLGIAIDEYGNFETTDRGKIGSNTGNVITPDSVSIRGPGDGYNTGNNYYYIGGTGTLAAGIDYHPGGTVTIRPAPGVYYRRVVVTVVPSGTTATYTVAWKTAVAGPFTQVLSGTIASITTPATLKLGFTASTGGSTNFHEIRNVQVSYPADLAVTKVHSPTSPTPGSTLTYTMVVTNNGPVNVAGAPFIDTIPSLTGVTWTCAVTGTGACSAASESGNTIQLDLDLNNAAYATITATGTLPNTTPQQLINTAMITPPNNVTDSNPANNTATDILEIGSPIAAVSITKAAAALRLQGGDSEYFTLNVANAGPNAATAVTVTDTLTNPPFASVGQVSTTQGTCSVAGLAVTCTLGVIPANATATIVIPATVIATTGTGSYNNTATVAWAEDGGTPATSTLAFTTRATVTNTTDLAVTKTHSTTGSTVTYTMVVTNTGTNVTGATFTDTVPPSITGVTWSCAHTTNDTCSAATGSGNTIGLTLGLNTGAANYVTITATGTITAGTSAQIINTATITPPATWNDTNGANNTATDIINAVDVGLTKTASVTTVANIGDAVIFTIVVSNCGPLVATGITLTDPLPTSFNFSSYTTTATHGSCTTPAVGATGTVTCALGQLIAPASVTVTITATANATGSWQNTATVTQNELDTNPANNSASVSGTTVPVTVARFVATTEPDGVRFNWTTAMEVSNAGYNIYAQSDGGLVRVNPQLIPSHLGDSTIPLSYEYFAEGVSDGPFFLEDVDIRARGRLHGPFAAGVECGVEPAIEPIPWRAIRAASLKASVQALAQPVKAKPVNLLVDEDGLYRVTYEALKGAGFDFGGVSASSLGLTNEGSSVPILILGPGSQIGDRPSRNFGPGMAVEFQGQAVDSLYTRTNVYTLSVSSSNSGNRVALDATPPPSGQPPQYYMETQFVSKPLLYSFASPTGDPWYEAGLLAYTTPVQATFTVPVDHLATGVGGARFSFDMWGETDWPNVNPDHHAVLELNGVTIADERFDGLTNHPVEGAAATGSVVEGTNTFTLTLPGDSGAAYEIVNVSNYAITYPRQFVARSGHLEFTSSGGALAVDGLSSSNVAVYRLGAKTPQRLTQVRIETGQAGLRARFAGSNRSASYLIYEAGAILTPTIAAPRQPSGLTGGKVDYLVISHPDFIAGLTPLVQARSAQGLRVRVVDVNDVYAAYNYGIVDPQAIHDYIAYAYKSMGTRYILLVGGDTYDYFDYLQTGSVSFIPTPYAVTGDLVNYAPADPLLADVNGNGVPDLALGRFPVRTPAELDSVIAKTLAYGARPNAAVFAADLADGSYSFKQLTEGLVATVPPGWRITRAYADDLGASGAKSVLLGAINQGVALASYVGHSGFTQWSLYDIFDLADAETLLNAGKPTVVAQMGCWNTYYVDPQTNTLAHKLLLSGDRGAAAVLGPATLSESESEIALARLLFPLILQKGVPLGTAVTQAKAQLAQTMPQAIDVLRGWTLLGDPALVIAPPLAAKTQEIDLAGSDE
ncbi:MAG: C25 family cysteine peptidase [Thermoanaerobaculaceae bacterium]|jgi:uncharacterized repeat protein (TIGR01451 family)